MMSTRPDQLSQCAFIKPFTFLADTASKLNLIENDALINWEGTWTLSVFEGSLFYDTWTTGTQSPHDGARPRLAREDRVAATC